MSRRRKHSRPCRPAHRAGGFTLAEVLITIGLAAVLLTVYTMMLIGTVFLRRSQHYAQASSLIQEEMDSLRLLPFSDLTNRTDGNFLNIILNRGDWTVQEETGGDGQGQRLALNAAESALINETGLIALPTNQSEDFSFSAKVRALSGSPSGWDAGLVFRYIDAENHYRFRFNTGGIAFDKVEDGTITTLWSQGVSHNPDTWYTLEVIASADSFTLKKNGSTLTTQTDAAFSKGELGLAAFDEALAEFDDVSATVNAVTSSWDYELYDEDAYPEDWRRIGWPDLPSGDGTLTIADYLGETTIKQVTVNIYWDESGDTKSVSGNTLILDNGL